MAHACCSPVFLLLKQPQAEAAEVPFPCTAPSALHPSATRHRPVWQVSSEQLQLLWWTGCPPQLLGIPPAFLPGTSGVDLPSLKSTFYTAQTVENCSWENKGCDIHENTEHIEQKTKDHLPCHLNSCISATLWGQTQEQTWCLMSYQALHGFTRNPVPRKADNGLHTDTTLPFNDFLKVSIISFQATTPLNSGCLFFAHLLLMVA